MGRPDRGDTPAPLLDEAQCLEFLRLVHEGAGRASACTRLGVSIRSLKRTLARQPKFRRAVRLVEQIRADNLFAVLYAAALEGDTRAACFLLDRHDRSVGRGRP